MLTKPELIVCKECGQVSVSQERHSAHLSEPRHIHHYRSALLDKNVTGINIRKFRFMAYKDPKRRKVWLKIWCKEIEKAEEEFPILYQIDE